MDQSRASPRIGHPAAPPKTSPSGKAAIVALALIVPDAAFAEQPDDTTPAIVCVVSGYDVIIYNKGADPIAPGVGVGWSVPLLRMSGKHVIDLELEPEGRFFLSGVLAGGGFLSPDHECIASLE